MNKDTIKEVMLEFTELCDKHKQYSLLETEKIVWEFIEKKLQEVLAETIKKCISAEPKRRKLLHSVVAKGSQEDLNDTWRHGYNSALDDYKSSLTKIL